VDSAFYDFSIPILTYNAAIVLVILGIRMLTEKVVSNSKGQHGHFHDKPATYPIYTSNTHDDLGEHTHEHTHPKASTRALGKLASCAFVLGCSMRKSLRC
jgi:ABC-type nickel/cobalt efflux system permease component RcnA